MELSYNYHLYVIFSFCDRYKPFLSRRIYKPIFQCILCIIVFLLLAVPCAQMLNIAKTMKVQNYKVTIHLFACLSAWFSAILNYMSFWVYLYFGLSNKKKYRSQSLCLTSTTYSYISVVIPCIYRLRRKAISILIFLRINHSILFIFCLSIYIYI